ncbi:hypothetical protein Q5P01_000084 [Channa striata]|uniref:Uncharacterized protein n=1 Tax=Channa striata TaxID=64152 RepID=A0AA88LM18_CHASR|nr:hypothetical protein Q5P01_000084 [Channa striata]
MPHVNAIKEQANFFPKNRLVVDAGTMEHVKNTGSLENTKVVMDLDADVFAKAKARVTKEKDPRVAQELDRFYDTLQEMYNEFRGNNFYASASDIMRYVSFAAYSDEADHLVYHDADVRFKPLSQDHTADLTSGAAVKIAMITSTKRTDRSLEKQLSFVEPSYFSDAGRGVPDYTQFNSDLILMRKARLQRLQMEATWAAAGPHSPYVEMSGEKFIRRDTCAVLRTLVLKGDMNTRKLFLSNCALNPADVGAVSRQDAQNWFGDSKSDHLDVPVYTLEEEAAIALPDGSPLSSPEHSGPSRPELTEVETPVKANPPVETGLSDIPAPEVHAPAAPEVNVDVSTLSLGFDREPHAVNPETGPRLSTKAQRLAGATASAQAQGELALLLVRRGKLFCRARRRVGAANDIVRVTADTPTALVKAFVQKRRNTVELARTQLEEIMSDPEVELAVKAMMTEAQGLIPGDRGRAVKRLGSAYARMATSGPKSQLAIKAWVLGARAHGVLTNIGALIYGDATVRTFAALDLSQTVNGFLAHKLARYAKTKALAETLELLADNPLMNLAGTAANVFFFAQNVPSVAKDTTVPPTTTGCEIIDADAEPGV